MRVISEAEASQGEKLMMLVDNCYHFTHRTCFKKYAKKTMLTMTKNGGFNDPKCNKCHNVIDEFNLQELLGAEEL